MPVFADNLLRSVKRANLFSPQESYSEDFRVNPSEFITGDINNLVNPANIEASETNSFKPKTDAQDRFAKLIDEFPIREKASIGRKILASLAGFAGGPERANEVLDRPYNEKLLDFKTKADIFGSAATRESAENRNAANFTLGEISRAIQQQRADTAQFSADVNLKRVEDLATKSAQIYEVKMLEAQQKVTAAEEKLKLAYDQLQFRRDDALADARFKELQLAAQNSRFELQLAQQQLQQAALEANRVTQARQADDRIRILEESLKQRGLPTITTDELTTDPKGNVTGRTRTTTRGESSRQSVLPPGQRDVIMTGPDGKDYSIPADKVAEAEKAGMKRK